MRAARACTSTLAATLLAGALAACAVPLQDKPQLIHLGQGGSARTAAPGPTAHSLTTTGVYLIRADKLVRVIRPVPAGDRTETALDSLLTGVLPEDSAQQLRSAIPAAVADVKLRMDGDVAIVRVPDAFLELAGPEQVFAVAQLVWTVSESGDVSGLRLVDERSTPIAVPIAGGDLVYRPVRRSDYRSLGPP